jgi:hypothetical protein
VARIIVPKERYNLNRKTIFLYGTLSYATLLATFLYAAGFIGNPGGLIGTFRRFYGPTMNAFEAAEASRRAEELPSQLPDLAKAQNKGTNDGTLIPVTFLRVTVCL